MGDQGFDLESFYSAVEASAKERHPLRHDLVRGLKDYFEYVYGYDRYGAETIFQLAESMAAPYVFGFAALRILHDRRITPRTKVATARRALGVVRYGTDNGLPFGMHALLHFLAQQNELSVPELRYGLTLTAGEQTPFQGMEKPAMLDFFERLLATHDMPVAERAFWAHSLLGRYPELVGAAELVTILLGSEELSGDMRVELCQAWINCRQPRLAVEIPEPDDTVESLFVAEHMPFWVAHMPSWPTHIMVRLGLIWLARLSGEPLSLAQTYMAYTGPFADQIFGAVADIIAEHHGAMPEKEVRALIERGIAVPGSSPTRRKFYRVGLELFGPTYLQRATADSANSVRQWAARQLQKQV